MRADALDLDIDGTRVRVVCEGLAGLAELRSALAEHLIDEPAPPGFALLVPGGKRKFHVLVDRSGAVLARVGSTEEALAVLGSHLAGLGPPPGGAVRIRGRAFLLDDSTAALALHHPFVRHPVVERRLARASLRIVDRLAVDIHPDLTIAVPAARWPGLGDLPAPLGHTTALAGPTPLGRVLVPQFGEEKLSEAAVVTLLAASSWGAARSDCLNLAERLAAGEVVGVPVGGSASMYAALTS